MQHGVGANMMKNSSKRKRTKKQIQKEEEAKQEEQAAIHAKLARCEELEYELQ